MAFLICPVSTSALDPALAARDFQEGEHVALQPLHAETAFQVGHDLADRTRAVAALHDFAGRAVQLDHALREQQDPGLLHLLPLQAKARPDPRPRLQRRRAARRRARGCAYWRTHAPTP